MVIERSNTTVDQATDGLRKALYRFVIQAFDDKALHRLCAEGGWDNTLTRILEIPYENVYPPVINHRLNVMFHRLEMPHVKYDEGEWPSNMELVLTIEEIHRTGKTYDLTFVCQSSWTPKPPNEVTVRLGWDIIANKGTPAGVYIRMLAPLQAMVDEVINTIESADTSKPKNDNVVVPLRKDGIKPPPSKK